MGEDMVTNPQEVVGGENGEGMASGEDSTEGMPTGEELSDEMNPPESGGGNSGFWPGPLGNTSPDESIDNVDGFRFGKEYIGKYFQRGFNKLTESSTTAGEDLLLGLVNAVVFLLGLSDGEETDEENEENEEIEINK